MTDRDLPINCDFSLGPTEFTGHTSNFAVDDSFIILFVLDGSFLSDFILFILCFFFAYLVLGPFL